MWEKWAYQVSTKYPGKKRYRQASFSSRMSQISLTLILEKEPQNTRRRLLYWSGLSKQRRIKYCHGGAHARTDVYPAGPWPNIDTEKNASLCWQGEIEHQWRSKDFYSSEQKENEREKGSNIPRTARESLKAKWQAKLGSVVKDPDASIQTVRWWQAIHEIRTFRVPNFPLYSVQKPVDQGMAWA